MNSAHSLAIWGRHNVDVFIVDNGAFEVRFAAIIIRKYDDGWLERVGGCVPGARPLRQLRVDTFETSRPRRCSFQRLAGRGAAPLSSCAMLRRHIVPNDLVASIARFDYLHGGSCGIIVLQVILIRCIQGCRPGR